MTHPHERWTRDRGDRFQFADTLFVIAILVILVLLEAFTK